MGAGVPFTVAETSSEPPVRWVESGTVLAISNFVLAIFVPKIVTNDPGGFEVKYPSDLLNSDRYLSGIRFGAADFYLKRHSVTGTYSRRHGEL